MHPPSIAVLLHAGAALLLATAPSTVIAQAVYGISERIPPFTPLHTAVYTTTLPPGQTQPSPPQVVTTTIVVTLYIPRDVGWPNGNTPVTGTAISHFSAAEQQPWSETAELVWTLRAGNSGQQEQAVPSSANKLASAVYTYTDYSHYTTEMFGGGLGWSMSHFDYVSTYRETIVEERGENMNYPATIIHTGYTTIEITVTGGAIRGALTTFTNPATLVSVRTTTLVQVGARPTGIYM